MRHFDRDSIQTALQKPLPGLRAHLRMAPPWRRATLEPEARYRPSAVLLLLYPEAGELHFPLIRRSSKLNHHANQIGFPGGALEPGETAEEAALREAREELGIQPESVRILGRLSPLGLAISGYTILPVVGYSEEQPLFTPNPEEVARWFTVPLAELFHRELIINLKLEDGREAPAYELGGEAVWGATAMILAEFVWILKD